MMAGVGSYSDSMIIVRQELQRLYDYCTAGVGSYSDSMIIVRQVSAATVTL